jgi:hypothetical protein
MAIDAAILPTSDMIVFKDMLSNPRKAYSSLGQQNTLIHQIKKNLIMSAVSDTAGVGHIRNIFPLMYMNSLYGKTGNFNVVSSPHIITQHELLIATRAFFLQRRMSPQEVPIVRFLVEQQKKLKFKLVYDIDDFLWQGDADEEGLPEYNFGKSTITPEVIKACTEIMQMCDVVCTSTKYLGDYISTNFGIDKKKIMVVPNTIPQFFWGTKQKRPIKEAFTKPRVIWTASPTHWNDEKKLAGDMDNAWREWVIKNVKAGKIDYIQMGGCPWFFEEIRNKITVVDWIDSFRYHLKVMQLKPDFSIGPLVPNKFNRAKSDIKYIEQCAVGSVFIGTKFADSPYSDCVLTVPADVTVDEIDDLFWKNCKPELYNKALKAQYDMMHRDGRYTESERNVNLLNSIL